MDTCESVLGAGPLLGIAVAAIAAILVMVIFFKVHPFATMAPDS